MRRDTFLKSLLAAMAVPCLPSAAWAATNVKMMIPANPGGGWDGTGRALGKALQEAGVASAVSYDNKGGAAGALGLARLVQGHVPCQRQPRARAKGCRSHLVPICSI